MTPRRAQLLDTAARLFAERGYDGVSVHEIGAACGVTGPALYRHFRGKDELLATVLVDISERLVAGASQRVDATRELSPLESVRALVRWHVEFALDHPHLIVVQEREWVRLPPADRERVRALQRGYVEDWVAALHRLRPDIDPVAGRARVQAVFGLLNSTPHSAHLERDAMHSLLEQMAYAALTG